MKLYGGVRYVDWPCPANVRRLDHGCLPMIHEMHKRGVRIDIPYLQAFHLELEKRSREIRYEAQESIGTAYQDFDGKRYTEFNLGSPDQVARLLFDHLQVHQGRQLDMTRSGKRPSVDDDALKKYKGTHPVVDLIDEYREINKLDGTYVQALIARADSDSRIHTQFSATKASTGRLASSNPNLQNIPVRTDLGKRIRQAFLASSGCSLLSADLSQIEMRWAAHRSKDPTMMRVFFDREDIHTRTACNIFGHEYSEVMALQKLVEDGKATKEQAAEFKEFKNFKRLPCKTVGFGVLYGQTAEGLQATLAGDGVIWTIDECEDLITNKFFGVYRKLREMLDNDYRTARRYEKIWDAFGRARLVPEVRSVHKRIVSEGLRKAGNHPEQASAAGTIKLAMAEIQNEYIPVFNQSAQCWPVLQVHDELIFDVHNSIVEDFSEVVVGSMEGASPLDVPVLSSADIAERWGDLK